jgi:hypothetical protein
MNALNAPARKVRVTAQQVAFLTLTEGVGKVIAMHNAPGSQIASATFDSAVDLLASQPTAQAALLEIRSDLVIRVLTRFNRLETWILLFACLFLSWVLARDRLRLSLLRMAGLLSAFDTHIQYIAQPALMAGFVLSSLQV